jgi:hypothetical protein
MRIAQARPIPTAAPVTMATFPFNRFMAGSLGDPGKLAVRNPSALRPVKQGARCPPGLGLTPLKNPVALGRQGRSLTREALMTPYLVLVLAGFGLFTVALGTASAQCYFRRLRAERDARRTAVRAAEGAPRAADRRLDVAVH